MRCVGNVAQNKYELHTAVNTIILNLHNQQKEAFG